MRKLRKGESYALLPTINNAQFKTRRSPLRFAHRDDEDNRGIVRYSDRSLRRCVPDDDGYKKEMLRGKQCLHSIKNISILSILGSICFIVLLFSDAQAQSAGERTANGLGAIRPIIVGQRVPDDFWKKEQLFYINGDTVRKTMEEFKGKPMIIDFWATWCISCLQGFPKLSHIQDRYKGRLNVLLANSKVTRDDYSKIHSMKDDILRKSNLTTVYNDEYLASIFHYVAIPHYIWINPKGIVSAVTFSEFVNEDQIESFINYNQKYEKDNQ